MGRIERTVFLSYRRTNAPWALAISQNLTHHGYDVFFDFTGIKSGAFESAILGNIEARAHFVVLLTPSALKRCGEPGDWLPREIERALELKRNIVPLMLEGFSFKTRSIARQLTGTLAVLKSYQALPVPVEFFDAAMKRLREDYLAVALDAVKHPATVDAREAARVEQAAVKAAPAVKKEELTAQGCFERAFNASDLDEQIRLYGEAIRLQPDFAEAFNNRGELRRRQGDIDAALKDLADAIRLKPDLAEAFYNRGIARRALGDLEGALRDYTEAIRMHPDFADAFVNRGIARYDQGDMAGALQDYNEAIRLKPDYAYPFTGRGNVRYSKGDPDGALQDYNEAIRLKPDYAYPFNGRGIVRYGKGDLDGALKDYNEAIRLEPDYADAYYGRALIWRARDNRSSAIADFQTYLDLGGGVRDGFKEKAEEMIRGLKK